VCLFLKAIRLKRVAGIQVPQVQWRPPPSSSSSSSSSSSAHRDPAAGPTRAPRPTAGAGASLASDGTFFLTHTHQKSRRLCSNSRWDLRFCGVIIMIVNDPLDWQSSSGNNWDGNEGRTPQFTTSPLTHSHSHTLLHRDQLDTGFSGRIYRNIPKSVL